MPQRITKDGTREYVEWRPATNFITRPQRIYCCIDPEPIKYNTDDYILAQCHCTDRKPGIALHLHKSYADKHSMIAYKCYTCGFEGAVMAAPGRSFMRQHLNTYDRAKEEIQRYERSNGSYVY